MYNVLCTQESNYLASATAESCLIICAYHITMSWMLNMHLLATCTITLSEPSINIHPDIIGITETWANTTVTHAELGLPGYVILIKEHLMKFLVNHMLISKSHHGFIKGRSCLTN